MESPGTLLQQARKERGLTLDDVAAMTRVPKPMLQHLEEDRFEEYEAEVFVRGHLRNYARELRLDVDEVLTAYERHTGRRKTDPLEEAEREGRIDRPTPGPKPIPGAASGEQAASKETMDGGGFSMVSDLFGGIRRTHLVAVVLVLVGLFVMISYVGSAPVGAEDTAELEEDDTVESNWELEQDVQDTRRLLDDGAESRD